MTDLLIPLTIILAATQALDYHTTTHVLDKGGKELNPVMVACFRSIGMHATLITKGIMVVGLGYWLGTQNIYVLAAVTAFYIGIIAYNYRSMP